MGDKSNLVLIIVVIAVSIFLVGNFFLNQASKECKNNKGCSEDSYCGSDFTCHQYPEEIIVEKNNYVWPAIILGVSLITTAFLFNRKKK